MRKIIIQVFPWLCCFLVSCHPLQYDELAEQEMFAFAREVKTTDQLKLLGYGGGFLERINHLSMTFESSQTPNIDEARFLFFEIAHRFLNQVNKSEVLRPYLSNYPFNIVDNLDLSIIFPESLLTINAVGMGPIFTHHKREFLIFTSYDPSTKDLRDGHIEPFEEALQIYEQQICH